MYLAILSHSPVGRKEPTTGAIHRTPLSLGTPVFVWPCPDHLGFFSSLPIYWGGDFPGLRARTFQAQWLAAVEQLRAHKRQLTAQRRFPRKMFMEGWSHWTLLLPQRHLPVSYSRLSPLSGKHAPKKGRVTPPIAGCPFKAFDAKPSGWKNFFFLNCPNTLYFLLRYNYI